jgi:Homing endonuclease associated repeat
MAIEIDFMKSYDRKSIIAEMRRNAKKLGKQTLTCEDINTYGRISAKTITLKLGSMQRAHKAAGLVPSRRRSTYVEMLKALVCL